MQLSDLIGDAPARLAMGDATGARALFPYFARADQLRAAGKEFPVYLDTAATSQRPAYVLDTEYNFAAYKNAAVHRGTSAIVGSATAEFEAARTQLAEFLGCGSDYSLVWQAGATDALNTLAFAFSEASISAHPQASRFALDNGSEILVTAAEHHANLIPWQRLAKRTGARLVVVPVTADGTWRLTELTQRLNPRTRIVAFTHVSNVTGWISPVKEVVAQVAAHAPQAVTVLDACQSVPHLPFNSCELGFDFAVFSGHKMFAPGGVGALIGKTELLNSLPPARTGGSAITKVTAETAEFLPAPQRFEPGTQPVSQAVALGAAAQFLTAFDMHRIATYEHQILTHLLDGIASLGPAVQLLGPAAASSRQGLAAITVAGIHPHDIGQVLDTLNVYVRVGHHCAQQLHRALGCAASVRASISFTTTREEIDAFIDGMRSAIKYFGDK